MDGGHHEVRISVQGLAPGMFVSRLDRPWIQSPFPLEGLKVETADEIRHLQRICSHVWVDTQRGESPDLRHVAFEAPVSRPGEAEEIARLRKTRWAIQSDFNAEVRQAEQVHATLEADMAEVMRDLQEGKKLDLGKLKDGVEAMVESILRNPSAFVWLREMKRRDNYTYQHALGCAIWAASFGRHLGLEREELGALAMGGLLIDVGKSRLPAELLTKAGPLTAEETALAREHVRLALELLGPAPGLSQDTIAIIATHHERYDGSGYPGRLMGSHIPLPARMLGIVDTYDAMANPRPFRAAVSRHTALRRIYAECDRLFQDELVEQFQVCMGVYPTGSLVELSTGEIAVVMAQNQARRLRPRVVLLSTPQKQRVNDFQVIDLMNHEASGTINIVRSLAPGDCPIDTSDLFVAA